MSDSESDDEANYLINFGLREAARFNDEARKLLEGCENEASFESRFARAVAANHRRR